MEEDSEDGRVPSDAYTRCRQPRPVSSHDMRESKVIPQILLQNCSGQQKVAFQQQRRDTFLAEGHVLNAKYIFLT